MTATIGEILVALGVWINRLEEAGSETMPALGAVGGAIVFAFQYFDHRRRKAHFEEQNSATENLEIEKSQPKAKRENMYSGIGSGYDPSRMNNDDLDDK